MSDIPQQKSALIQFLRKYLLGAAPGHQPPQISATQLTASYATVTSGLTASAATVTSGLTASYLRVSDPAGISGLTPGVNYSEVVLDSSTDSGLSILAGSGAGDYAAIVFGHAGLTSTAGNVYLGTDHLGLSTDVDLPIKLYSNNLIVATFDSDKSTTLAGDLTVTGDDNSIAQEAWTVVDAYGTGNQQPEFALHWQNYGVGGTYQVAGFMKDSMGFVHLRGLVQSTHVARGTTIFTLPSGYRPTYTSGFGQRADQTAMGSIYVKATGAVTIATGETAVDGFIWLDGITFDTR
jgi:hypothetical protein